MCRVPPPPPDSVTPVEAPRGLGVQTREAKLLLLSIRKHVLYCITGNTLH